MKTVTKDSLTETLITQHGATHVMAARKPGNHYDCAAAWDTDSEVLLKIGKARVFLELAGLRSIFTIAGGKWCLMWTIA